MLFFLIAICRTRADRGTGKGRKWRARWFHARVGKRKKYIGI